MPTDLELLARLALAAVLGGAVGAERELSDQPAGLRTHMLLTIGACLFTLVSAYGFEGPGDPARIAAQIVTGIGFLGGGAILRHGASIRGLTTAASIWASAALGVAVGAGRYVLALGATVLVLATLVGLRAFRNVLRHRASSREEFSLLVGPGFSASKLTDLAHKEKIGLRGLERTQNGDGGRVQVVVKLPPRYDAERFLEALTELEGVREVEWER
ncbi:MAG TPA: MgtC/SapB family protein [Actinomycetes bacterium]|jgi:putative Mg2+ transporter-C (MgtC) family protein|nr:MgtC/SapB family protein [Actinomycetes bacterium]